MAKYSNNSSVVWKVVLAVVTILVMAFFALSIYCGVEGKSYKEVFTSEEAEVIEEEDKTPTDDNQDEEEIVVEDEATKTTVAISLN